jgi:cysteine-rich repeat protein
VSFAVTRHAPTATFIAATVLSAVPLAAVQLACGDSAPSVDDTTDAGTTEPVSGSSESDTDESDTDDSDTDESDSTGEPAPVCGDAVIDPGEACDDGNLDDGDGCTPTCELGPCAFEWLTRELALTGSEFEISTPLVRDGDDLVVAHQLGDGAQQTGLVRASSADGAAFASVELNLGSGSPSPTAMALGPDGELFLARVGAADMVEVHRLSEDGTVAWTVARPTRRSIPDLRMSASGELLLVNSIDNGPMDDQVELAALDPLDGSELWAHAFGGPAAPNGFSSDRAAALALADDGQTYVGYDQYIDWDTLAPVVVAFNPDGDPLPLWSTQVLEMPGRQPQIQALAVGPSGEVAVIFQREDGTQKFWVASLDGLTGAVEFVVERDDFGLPDQLSRVRAVAVTNDRVLAAGTWITDIDGLDVYQGFVLGLDFAGELVCVGTIDDYDPEQHFTDDSFLPAELIASEAGLYLAGYVYAYNAGQADLLLAKIR